MGDRGRGAWYGAGACGAVGLGALHAGAVLGEYALMAAGLATATAAVLALPPRAPAAAAGVPAQTPPRLPPPPPRDAPTPGLPLKTASR